MAGLDKAVYRVRHRKWAYSKAAACSQSQPQNSFTRLSILLTEWSAACPCPFRWHGATSARANWAAGAEPSRGPPASSVPLCKAALFAEQLCLETALPTQ